MLSQHPARVYCDGQLIEKIVYCLITTRINIFNLSSEITRMHFALLFCRFRDHVFSILLFSCGLYCISLKDTFAKPLRNTPATFLVIFSVYVGNYVYKFFQDFLLRKEHPLYKINLLHHFVTATAYGVLIVYR